MFRLLLQACPLNPNPQPLTGQQELLQDFSKRFSPAIRGVVEFAKRIPGFSLLAQDDQVTLLKAGVFEVLLVRLACMFDAHTSSMVCLNGQVLRRDSIHNSSNARFLMDSMFDFAERVNALRLSDAEIGLFCSVVVIAADRPGLRNTELIERMHSKLRNALHSVMAQNRPGQPDACHELMKKIPDLRTLNTLHSEKLLAFKMTEQQQQLQQQQLNQHQQWTSTITSHPGHHQQPHHDNESKSPAGSSWSSGSDVTIDEAKSPLGSVSSTESLCSAEISASVATASISSMDYHHSLLHSSPPQQQPSGHHASSAPLLAATLAGGLCPHRHRANSGSSGDDELAAAAHLVHNGLTITPVRSHLQHHQMTRTFRKLDSPSDSGIESGTENRPDRLAPGSAPTSLCSSPRSSLEDHSEDMKSNSLSIGSSSSRSVEDMPVLKRVLQAPPLYDTNSLMDEAYKPHKKFRALRNPKDSAEAEAAVHQQYPTPAASVSPVSIPPPQTQPSATITHLSQALTQPPQQSSLSSTHSTLAKSLMEGPRMTAEQMKRTDIIHNYIMGGSLLVCASPTQSSQSYQSPAQTSQQHHHQVMQQQHSPQYGGQVYGSSSTPPVAYGTSVITTTQATCRQSQPSYVLMSNSPAPPAEVPRIYFHTQSPAHSTSASPTPMRKTPTPASPSSSMTKQLVELKVDIADSQQPLNLSKKSPSPSPMVKLEA